jgi:hypothetical protein
MRCQQRRGRFVTSNFVTYYLICPSICLLPVSSFVVSLVLKHVLSIHVSFYLSIYLSIYLPTYQSASLYFCVCRSLCLSVQSLVCLHASGPRHNTVQDHSRADSRQQTDRIQWAANSSRQKTVDSRYKQTTGGQRDDQLSLLASGSWRGAV